MIFAFLLNFFLAFRRSAGTPYEVFFAFQRSAGTPYDFYSGSGVPPVPEPDFFSALRSAGSGTGGTRFRNAFHRFRFFHIHVIFQVTYFFQVVTNLLFDFRTTVESYLHSLFRRLNSREVSSATRSPIFYIGQNYWFFSRLKLKIIGFRRFK